MPQRTKPPFRADHVGSLLRPQVLKEARARFAIGEMSAEQLRTIEDQEILRIIERQQAVGMSGITDGELRRTMWHKDFLQHLDGISPNEADVGLPFKGIVADPLGLKITGKIGCASHPHVGHFAFVRDHTTATPKMTIPSPSMMTPLGPTDFQDPERPFYRDLDELCADFAEAYRKAIFAFHDAGCRYLQIDEVRMLAVSDPGFRERRRMTNHDVAGMVGKFAGILERALRDRPSDMVISMHLCRGNFRSHWAAEGGYEPIAERLLNLRGVDAFFLEYDTERAGGFEPLRFLPADKLAVLGLITSKTSKMEDPGEVKRRIDEATRFADLDRLCLSPQCGFASTQQGNAVTECQQWAKLELVRRVADEVWGGI